MRKGICRLRIVWLIGSLCCMAAGIHEFQKINEAEQQAYDFCKTIQKELHVQEAEDESAMPESWIPHELTEMPTRIVEEKEVIGEITFPSLGIRLPVLDSWSYLNLALAPCRYMGTIYRENMIICAHNYTSHFGRIDTLNLGDQVIFSDVDGNEYLYYVSFKETLQPEQVDELVNNPYALSLFTCTPGGESRVVIRCNRIS